MSFNVALTSPQLTQLRRARWQGNQYISFCDNVYALAARVNGAINATSGTTSAVIIFDTVTAGAYTNIDEGMTVIVSPTSDVRHPAAVRLHVRYLGAGATFVYVSEFSDPIADNAYLFVLYHYDIIDNLSRPYGTNPVVQLQQYDQAFQRMAPVIRGLQTGYANWVNGSGNYDIAFDISDSFAAESGGTISSYAYSVKATGGGTATVIAGSAATANVTYRFTYGEYWLKAVVTDSNGISSFRHVLIKAHDPNNYPPSYNFEGVEITRDVQQGQAARIKAFGDVSTLINGTMVIIWVDEQYSDVDFGNAAGALFNNIDMIGWIESEENMFVTDASYSTYAEVSFEVQGIGPRLMRLEGQMLAITYSASPTLWDQINNLTVWRAIVHFLQRHTTALQLGDFAIDNDDNTFLFPTIVTNAGRALDNVTGNQGIADEINGVVEFASDGRIQLVRREPFVATDLSHTPIVVATWDGQDMIDQFRWSFNHYQQYGYLDADGAAWSGVVNVPVMPCKNRAPGLAQGSGPDQGKLNNQILASTTSIGAAQGELAQRAGTQFAVLNNVGVLSINHPAQFHWLQPSFGQVYIWDLDATFNIRGWVLDSDTHWMLKSLTVRHDNKAGSRDVNATYIPVQTGNPGTNIPIINPNQILPALPILPPMPAFPGVELPLFPEPGLLPSEIGPLAPPGSLMATDGNTLLVTTGDRVFLLRNFIKLTTPQFNDITPADAANIPDVKFSTNLQAGYVLSDNPGAGDPVSNTYDFISSNGGFVTTDSTIPSSISDYPATWASMSGWQSTVNPNFTNYMTMIIVGTFTSLTVTSIVVNYVTGAAAAGGTRAVKLYSGASVVYDTGASGLNTGTGTFSTTLSPASIIADKIWIELDTASTSVPANYIKSVVVSGVSNTGQAVIFTAQVGDAIPAWSVYPLPGGASGYGLLRATSVASSIMIYSAANGEVRLSTDDGATFGSAISTGTTPGAVGGFDVQRSNTVSYAAAAGKVRKATTLGGAYSDWYAVPAAANPVCVVIPYYRRNSTTKNTAVSDPDVVIACDNGKVYWINGTTATATDITPTGMTAFDNANCLTTSFGHHLACFGKVGGTYHLFTSTNGGTSWTDRGARTAPKFIRTRRNDGSASVSGSNKGQLYLADSNVYWSSLWASTGPWIRNMPDTPIIAFDTLY